MKKFQISNFKFCNSPSPIPLPQGEGARGRAGFTLVEIMIALAIVGGVVVTVLYTVNYHADTAYNHTIATKMLFLAKEKIVEMEQDPRDKKGGIPDTDFTYENSVTPTDYENIIEIKTIIRGEGKEVTLNKFVSNKETQQ